MIPTLPRAAGVRRYSAHLGYLFSELPFAERFGAAARAGFSIVEHPNPYALSAERIRDLCKANGLTFLQMALPAGDAALGEKGLAGLPGREEEFRETVDHGLDFARIAGARFVHVMAGVRPAGSDVKDVWPTYTANLSLACDVAERRGMAVLVEAIGAATISDYIMDDPRLALKAVDDVGSGNLTLLFDAFHETNAGRDPVDFLRRHHASVSHVHIADHPGRNEPGTGTMDFDALFRVLDEVRYGGAIGLEYVPKTDTLSSLAWRERYLGRDGYP